MNNDYQQRIDKVLKYIDEHIDESLNTETLCKVAHFSQFHFHRLFTALVGMPLIKYIKYIKLKKAAYQLMMQTNKQIIDIAFDAGFESHEAFSRAFKKACGLSPRQFKATPNWDAWLIQPYKIDRDTTMTVEIKKIDAIRTAAIEHKGNYKLLNNSAAKLIDWCKQNNHKLKAGEFFGIVYNDPEATPEDEFRFNICTQVNNNMQLDNNVIEYIIPKGKYAVARHLGSHDNIGDTLRMLFREWLPNSGCELRDVPCFFQYHNFTFETQESALVTDVYLPIK